MSYIFYYNTDCSGVYIKFYIRWTPSFSGNKYVRGRLLWVTGLHMSVIYRVRTMKRYWLMKTEPDTCSIDYLKRDAVTACEGIRNYQARNLIRDEMHVGDEILIYHSGVRPPGVVGLARVVRGAYPGTSARDRSTRYYDPRSIDANPIWLAVDIKFTARFSHFVAIGEIKASPDLKDMMVARRGMRLSVQPVEARHLEIVTKLGKGKTL